MLEYSTGAADCRATAFILWWMLDGACKINNIPTPPATNKPNC